MRKNQHGVELLKGSLVLALTQRRTKSILAYANSISMLEATPTAFNRNLKSSFALVTGDRKLTPSQVDGSAPESPPLPLDFWSSGNSKSSELIQER